MEKINKYLVKKHVSSDTKKFEKIYDEILNVAESTWASSNGYLNSSHPDEVEKVYKEFMKIASDEQKIALLEELYPAGIHNGECLLQNIAKVVSTIMQDDEDKSYKLEQVSNNESII